MGFFKAIARAGLEMVVNHFAEQPSQGASSAAAGSQPSITAPGLKPSGNSFLLGRADKEKHPTEGYEVQYYDARFAKISVYGPGEFIGQRFDFTTQPEGKWIALHDAGNNPLPIRAARRGNQVLIEWLV